MLRNEHLAAIAAALVLVIAMGFGRFAFTGLYPLMVADHQISVQGGSYAASSNYAGYLAGALLAGFLLRIPGIWICTFAVISTAMMLGVLALPLPEWLIIVVRGLAGVSSAIAMVAASHWLLHERGHHHGVPALFAGVGMGILLSAEIIAAADRLALSSRMIWLVLGLVALGLTALTVLLQIREERRDGVTPEPIRSQGRGASHPFGAVRLILVYGLAGFGYIITATYLPLLASTAFHAINPLHVWAVFGLGAVPACFFWHALHMRWGTGYSLMANLLVQAIGVMLPLVHAPAAYIASALLVGGTFTGTVTIAMPAARRVAGQVRFNMLALMTASYGVGQIIGPLIAGALYGQTRSFDAAILGAGIALLVAAGLCAVPQGAFRPIPVIKR